MLTSAMEREDWLMATLPALLVVLPEHQRAVYDVVTARLGDAPVERTAGKEKTSRRQGLSCRCKRLG
jgi:hypothetical protein